MPTDERESGRSRLRVGVVVADGALPRWVAATLAEIDRRAALVALLVHSWPRRSSAWPWRAYASLDLRFVARLDDALAEAGAGELPSCERVALPRTPADRLGALALDLVVVLAEGRAPKDLAAFARLGVLAVTVDEGPPAASLEKAFAERHPTVKMAAGLEQAAGGVRELASARSALDLGSLGRTRNELLWKASALLTRGLDRLLAERARPAAADEAVLAAREPRGLVRPPSFSESLGLVGRLVTGAAERRWRAIVQRDPWFLALRPHRPGSPGQDVTGFTSFFAPSDRYWADPFLFRKDGVSHLFFEEFQWSRGAGEIAWVPLEGDRVPAGPLPAEVVLSCSHHLAYPLVFEHRGEVYLMPDNEEVGGVELWRAEEFPRRFTLERVLLEGLPLADVTLLEHADLLWLFATMPAPHGRGFDELHLFWAERLQGPWTPHPANPVVADIGAARGAGRIVRCGESLVRPAQDSRHAYGGALTFQVIRSLSRDHYVEETGWRLEPTWQEGLIATHTWNSDGCFDAIDGRTRRPRG